MIPGEKKSTHTAMVVPVVMQPHGNADKLSVVEVGGFTCVVNTADWEGKDRGVYIQADTLVDVTLPEFAWLADKANKDGKARIKAVRLRGVPSFGLLVPTTADIGTDQWEALKLERYEPPIKGTVVHGVKLDLGGDAEPGPDLDTGPTCYDIDALENHMSYLEDGEIVVVTEKLDGANVRYVYHDGRFWVKSRNRWPKSVPDYSHVTPEFLASKDVKPDVIEKIMARVQRMQAGATNEFWVPLLAPENEYLRNYLKEHPGTTVFGEIFGETHRIKYGPNRFRVFDIYRDGRFLDHSEYTNACMNWKLDHVPILYCGPYSHQVIKTLRDGRTTLPDTRDVIREGVVVKPLRERYARNVGRVIFKSVSVDFLALKAA